MSKPRDALIRAIGDGFTAYAESGTKAYQEAEERRTAPDFMADAILALPEAVAAMEVIEAAREWRRCRAGDVPAREFLDACNGLHDAVDAYDKAVKG